MMPFNGNKRYRAQALGDTLVVSAGKSTSCRVRRGVSYVLTTNLQIAKGAMHFSSGGSTASNRDIPFSYEKDLEFTADSDTIAIFNASGGEAFAWLREEYAAASRPGAATWPDDDEVT